jgi:ribosomal protein L40E
VEVQKKVTVTVKIKTKRRKKMFCMECGTKLPDEAKFCFGCGKPATPPAPAGLPPGIKKWAINPPPGVLAAIGNACEGEDMTSRAVAETRAKMSICGQMSTKVQDMVRDYTTASVTDPSAIMAFQEYMAMEVFKADLSGAKVAVEEHTDDDTCWVAVTLDKAAVIKILSPLVAAAKQKFPGIVSINIEQMIRI